MASPWGSCELARWLDSPQPQWNPGTLRGETGQQPEVTPVTCRQSLSESRVMAFEGLDGGEQAARAVGWCVLGFGGDGAAKGSSRLNGVRVPSVQATAPIPTPPPWHRLARPWKCLQGLSKAQGCAPSSHPRTRLLGQGGACGLAGHLDGSRRLARSWPRAAAWARDTTKPCCCDPLGPVLTTRPEQYASAGGEGGQVTGPPGPGPLLW